MSVLIVSDIHGSEKGISLVVKAIMELRPEMTLSAGDQCPEPRFASFFASLVAVRGNCDRFFDYTGTFPPVSRTIELYGRRVFMAHGDTLCEDDFDMEEGDVFVSGHTHVPHLEKRGRIYLCNPGSPSRPRTSAGPTAALMDEKALRIVALPSLSVLASLSFQDRT